MAGHDHPVRESAVAYLAHPPGRRALEGPTDELFLIAACTRHGRVIGADGALPWRHPEDLAFFKNQTRGHAVIMGRKSFASLGRPLPGRANLVVSRQPGLRLPGAEVFATVEDAIAAARGQGAQPPYIIGGAQIYAHVLTRDLVTRIHLTEIDGDHAGDTVFPPLDHERWRETARRRSGVLTFLTLDRVRAAAR